MFKKSWNLFYFLVVALQLLIKTCRYKNTFHKKDQKYCQGKLWVNYTGPSFLPTAILFVGIVSYMCDIIFNEYYLFQFANSNNININNIFLQNSWRMLYVILYNLEVVINNAVKTNRTM